MILRRLAEGVLAGLALARADAAAPPATWVTVLKREDRRRPAARD
ncbi:hypothetical protein [Nonomuraea rubra]